MKLSQIDILLFIVNVIFQISDEKGLFLKIWL